MEDVAVCLVVSFLKSPCLYPAERSTFRPLELGACTKMEKCRGETGRKQTVVYFQFTADTRPSKVIIIRHKLRRWWRFKGRGGVPIMVGR